MDKEFSALAAVAVILLLCRYSSAQGDCSPAPPTTLIDGGPSGALLDNNVPNILIPHPSAKALNTLFRPVVGPQGTDPWAVFSATEVRQHGLWCQVQEVNTNNIGDWYYPTPNGLLALDNINNDSTPYQELKCDNQVGLVVDGDIMNNQGIVRCTTNIPGRTTLNRLSTDANYLGVYEDSVITTIRSNSGPVVESNMTLTLLHTRDVDGPSVQFRLSFNVSLGLPSRITCTRDGTTIRSGRGFVSGVNYEVVRPLYVSASQPEITRVSFEELTRPRVGATYSCTVYVEGRINIASGTYNFDQLGSATSTVTVTVAGTPIGVTAIRNGYNSVLVSWTAPSPAPAGYEVFHQTNSDATSLSVGNSTSTMMTVTGLTLGVTYYIFVVSFGAEGAPVLPSAHSMTAQVILQIPQLSGTPTLTPDTTSIMVSWTRPQFLPDNYTVSYSCQLLCDSQPLLVQANTVTGTANNHTISSLIPGSSCIVNVTAVFGDINSDTTTSSTNTSTAAPTGAPGGLINTSLESRSLSVVWGAVHCPYQGGPIIGYRLRYSNGTSIVNTAGEGSRRHVLDGLTPFTSYSMQVAAINDGGTGPYSPALIVETLQDVPGAVVNLTVYTFITKFTLSWSPPIELNGVIIVYEVCSDSSDSEMFICTNTSATNHTQKNIPPETSVSIAVRAYTIIGPGENVTVENSTESVPIVSDVSVTALNSTSVMVSWSPVNLAVMYYYTVNYTIMGVVNGTVTFPSMVSAGVVSGLQGGQQYQFSVTVTLNISGELYTGSHNNTLPPITLPRPPMSSSASLISSSEATTILGVTTSNAIPSSSFSSSSLLPSSTSKTSPVNSTSTLPAAAAAIVVLLILAILVAVIIIIIIIIIKKRKEPKSFAVHYLKEGPKVDQAVGSEQLYVTVASKPYFEQFPDDDSVIEGKKVLLPVKIIGSPHPTLTWYHDNTRLGNDYAHEITSDGSLTIITAEMRHSGTYRLVATNSEGTVEKQFSLKVITEEDEEPPFATAAEMIKSRPVPVAEFGQYVSQNHANGNKGFSSLYTSLESGEGDHPVTVGLNPANKPLNRFNNITVYDDNRIELKPLSDCQNNYINASYVDGYESFHKFIACQGPLKKTLTDFWRMIWQENVHSIAMVTNLKESNKIKCQQYWPDNGSKNFGPFIVTTTDQLMCADYIVRLLQVELTEGSNFPRMITQYHFTSWPDHDVPEYATSILAYHRRIKKDYNPSQGPMVVHCSAGVGRTGTLIAIDTLLEQVEKAKMVDVCGVITKMRHQRMKMVQTTNQFAFIHDVILESVTCGDTQINSGDLRFTIAQMRTKQKESSKTGFEIQFEILNQVTPNPSEVKVLTATQNKNMNRSMKFLPPDKHRVQLKGVLPDYIHATFVNGYKHKKAFIVAQNPMESTTKDFWKLVMERECTVVVMLCGLEENGQEVCHQYWPSTGIQNYGNLLVGTTRENKCDGYTERVLSITDQSGKTQHQVTQFHIRNWNPQGKCSNPQTIITVMEEVYKIQRRTDNKPIVVHCSDTVSRAGMFCAIATTIDHCKTESVVDVFQVVKAQRIQKPGLVLTVEQYQFVFEAVLTFLESFETYSNFK